MYNDSKIRSDCTWDAEAKVSNYPISEGRSNFWTLIGKCVLFIDSELKVLWLIFTWPRCPDVIPI